MEKKRIGFDLDGVLYPWHDVVYDLYKNTDYIGGDDRKSFWKEFLKNEGSIFVCNILADMSLFGKYQMNTKIKDMLNRLKKNYDIFFVSQRPNEVYIITIRWLKDVGLYEDNLYLTDDKTVMSRILNLDYFVEDRPGNVDQLKSIVKTFIVSAPFNMDYYDEDVIRLNYTIDLEDYL